MPKEVPKSINIERLFYISERFRKRSVFDDFRLAPQRSQNQTHQKKTPRRRPTVNETSGAEAKEEGGGGGEVNLPSGSKGSEDQIGKAKSSEDRRKIMGLYTQTRWVGGLFPLSRILHF